MAPAKDAAGLVPQRTPWLPRSCGGLSPGQWMPCLIMCTTVSLGLCMSTGDSGALLSAALKTWVQGSGTPSWAAPPASHGALPRAPSHAVYSVRPLSSARPSTTALRATRLRPAAGGPTAGRSQRRSPSPSGGQGRRSAPRHTTGQGRQSAVGELEDLAQALQRGRKRSSAGLQREMVGLCEVVHTSAAGYGAEDLCRVARALATLGACNKAFHAHLHGPGRGVLRAISGRVLELDGQDLSARQGAQLLHAFGKMQVNDKALVQRSAQAILRGPVNWQGIAMSMWGLAKMRSSQTAVLDAFTSRIASGAVTGEPAASHLAQVAWALGKCRVRRPGVMTMIATWTLQEGALDTFKPQEISNTVWAYATLDVLHPRLMAAIAARTLQAGALERFAPQAVANTVWAFATLGVYHPKLMAAIAARTLQEGALYRFKPQEIANTVWAFATLNVHHPKLMAAIAARMLQEGALDTFKPQEISNTVWAYATLDFLHPRLMAAIAARTLQAGALERFAPQAVANTVWAFATLGVYHPKLMAAIAARTLQEGALYRFKPQEIANTVWAFGLLGVHHPRLMAAIAAQMQQEGALGQFDMQNVANTAWAFATLGALRPQLAAAFSTYVNQNVQDPPAMLPWQEVTSLAWALTVSDAFHDIATSKLLKLAAAAYAREDVSRQGLFQLHQVFLHVHLHESDFPLCHELLPDLRRLVDRCAHAFTETRLVTPSKLQGSVAAALRRLGVKFREEVVPPDGGGYSVDMMLWDGRVVEVDGPNHFVQGPRQHLPSGATLLKRRQLEALGYSVVSVPFWEWDHLRSDGEQTEYLQQRGLAPAV